MCGATWRAICIIRTAPIAKLGATNTFAPSAPALSMSDRSASRSKPVVPTTKWTPARTQSRTFSGAASGVVKSTITSAFPSASPTGFPSVRSALATSSRPSASSTASQTVAPMRPAAPDTTTRITEPPSDGGECLVDRRGGRAEPLLGRADASGRQLERVIQLAGELRHVLCRDRVDPGQQRGEREQGHVEEHRPGDARHPGPRRLQPEHHPALDVLLCSRQLLARQSVACDGRELSPNHLASLADLVLAGADVHRDHPRVNVLVDIGPDGVGQAARLADLAEKTR